MNKVSTKNHEKDTPTNPVHERILKKKVTLKKSNTHFIAKNILHILQETNNVHHVELWTSLPFNY